MHERFWPPPSKFMLPQARQHDPQNCSFPRPCLDELGKLAEQYSPHNDLLSPAVRSKFFSCTSSGCMCTSANKESLAFQGMHVRMRMSIAHHSPQRQPRRSWLPPLAARDAGIGRFARQGRHAESRGNRSAQGSSCRADCNRGGPQGASPAAGQQQRRTHILSPPC